jgi:hypothetical protein
MILLLFLSLLSFVSARWEEVTNLCYEDEYLYACVTEGSYTLMIGNSINEAVPNPTSTPQIIINDNVVDNFIELRHNGKHSSRCTDAVMDFMGTSQCCTGKTDYTSQSYTEGSTCIDLDPNVYFVNKEFDGPKSAPLFCGDCGGDQRWWRSSFAHPDIPFTRWETNYVGTFNYGYVGVPDNICVDHFNTVTNDNFYSVQDDTNKPWNSVTKVCAYERHVYACAHGPTLSGGRGGVNRLPSDISAHQYNFPVLTIDSVETRDWITIDGNAKRSSCGDSTSILYVYGLCSPETPPEVVPASEFSILDAAALKTDLESSCGVCDDTWWRTVNETQFTADSVWRITGTDYPVSGFDINLQDKDYSKIPNTFKYMDVAFDCSDLPESHVCNDDCGYNLVLPVCDGTNTDKNCQCGNCACAAGRECNSGICLPSRDLKIKHTEQCACISTQKMDNGICVNCPVGKLSTPFIDCGCDIEIGSEISFSKGDYFDETSWEIRQCNNDLILEGSYSSVNDCLHLPDNYIVVLKDSFGDGWHKFWSTGKDNVLTISNTSYTFSAGRRAYFEIGSCCVAENSHLSHLSTTTGECKCNNNYRDVYSDASECQICLSNTELINNVCVACHSSMESESGGQCTCMSGLTELSVHSGQNPEKIAWEIKDSGGNIINSGNNYDDSCKNDICDVQCVDLNNAKTMNLINLINDARWDYNHWQPKLIEYYVLLNGIKYFHTQQARSTLHNIMCTSSDCATCDSGLTQVMVYSGSNPSKMVWEFRQNDDTVINSENYLYKSFDHCKYGICEYLCLDLPDSYKLTLKNSIGVSNWGFSFYKIVINDNTSEPREYTHTVSNRPITYYIGDEHCTDVVIKNEHEPTGWDYTEARVEIRSCSGNAIYNVFPKSGIDYDEVCLPPKYNIVLQDTYGDGWENWNITINNNYFKLVSGYGSIQEHDNRC